ncbi:helix-turn-helix domain-containing protein [Ruminiclostridium papyrosolvens]|uniref:XRE family transcriptional regulator n=1 Tax=Ruminiclostridium papyrosolvens C7 TaxID=1330534 RepID=U4R5U5_9FIRM|nr:helix-turn-helix domain-containing protein [Ruminiclostridium papyrosolvens]EPR13415.1 XRE family transcriptional regulator [Ruminiclostridium papyrosolvens C7]
MDCSKVGKMILHLRKEQGLTQKNIADTLNISNKTVSKWERGLGCPDVSILASLSQVLGADMQKMLEGELDPNRPNNGNIKKIRFYVCPTCSNVLTSTNKASISCCGRKLEPLEPMEHLEHHKMTFEEIDIYNYISIDHEMNKSHFIRFIAYVGADIVLIKSLYPEQDASIHIPVMQRGGKLYGYCSQHGLWVQSI